MAEKNGDQSKTLRLATEAREVVSSISVSKLTVPILLVISLLGVTVMGTSEFGNIKTALREQAIYFTHLDEQTDANSLRIDSLTTMFQTRFEERFDVIENVLESRAYRIEAYQTELERIRAEIVHLRQLTETHIQGHVE